MNNKYIVLLCFSLLAILLIGCGDDEYIDTPIDNGGGNGGTEEIDYSVPTHEINEMEYTSAQTRFSVWAPSAEEAQLSLYQEATGGTAEVFEMEKGEKGIWSVEVNRDLKGSFYTFRVKVDGKWLYETQGIFAKAVGVNGNRGAVINLPETNPTGWNNDKGPEVKSMADVVIYEVHYRDFSIHPSAGSDMPGKFLSLSESGRISPHGLATGIDHLKELGITHVHILPSADFASIEETQLEKNVYNWGYDPKNYNVPEGSYASDPSDPAVRIKEFKEMIQALHTAGIGVIMDVVYNHTTSVTACGFEQTVPGYFYRMNADGSFSNGSACGNELATEQPMMRKFMLESLAYWVKEYHIDGFRFDLMGLHDITTMNQVRNKLVALNPSIVLYGEGWTAGSTTYDTNLLALKQNVRQLSGIAAFGDDFRDAMRGPTSNYNQGGFVVGTDNNEMSIRFGLIGATSHDQIDYSQVNYSWQAWAVDPVQHISYVSCHDDHCLRDRLEITAGDLPEEEIVRLSKLSQAIVFTSQGVPFLFAGEELFRTKQGNHNSYNSPDEINAIDWNNKEKYYDLFEYNRELIAIRKQHAGFRLATSTLVRRHLEFIESASKNVVAFRLKNLEGIDEAKGIVVAFNSNREEVVLQVPEATYTILAEDAQINREGLREFTGGEIILFPSSALIMVEY